MNSTTALKIPSKTWTSKTTTALSKLDTFLATYRQQQEWSLPDSLIYYITKNPSSPKCYEKMIQSCNFFIKNPILVVASLYFCYENKYAHYTLFNDRSVDLTNSSSIIWVTHVFHVSNRYIIKSNFFLAILPKIYQCNITELFLYNQNFFLNDLKLVASKAQKIVLNGIIVSNESGDIVSLEEIIKNLPCAKQFEFYFDNNTKIISPKTVDEILKIPHFWNFTNFKLSAIPETFDIDAFFDGFIKKNMNTHIELCYGHEISDEYAARLQRIVDEIINNENRIFKAPLIRSSGITHSSSNRLYYLYSKG